MPKAKILENMGESQYRVQLLYDDAQYQTILNEANTLLTKLDEELVESEAKAEEEKAKLEELGTELENSNSLLAAAYVLEQRFQAVALLNDRVTEAQTLVDQLSGRASTAQDDVDTAELDEDSAQQSVLALTDERDALQDEYDNLVALQAMNEQACREAGYEGEACVLAADYERQAEAKLADLERKQQELDEAGDDLDAASKRVTIARSVLDELEDQLRDAESELRQHQVELGDAQVLLDGQFSQYNMVLDDVRGESIEPQDSGYEGRIEKHQGEVSKARADLAAGNEAYQLARLEVDRLKVMRKKQRTRLDEIRKTETGPELECWTSTWNDQLEVDAEVEVVLMPGEPQSCVIHEAGIANDRLTPPVWQTPAQALLNYMLLPGWQRWEYRFGVAEVVDSAEGESLPLSVIDYPSSAQALPTGRESFPSAVRGAEGISLSLFEKGDLVLIDYEKDQPEVAGWFEEPKPGFGVFSLYPTVCGDSGCVFQVYTVVGWDSFKTRSYTIHVKKSGGSWSRLTDYYDTSYGRRYYDDKGRWVWIELEYDDFLSGTDHTGGITFESGRTPEEYMGITEYHIASGGKTLMHVAIDTSNVVDYTVHAVGLVAIELKPPYTPPDWKTPTILPLEYTLSAPPI